MRYKFAIAVAVIGLAGFGLYHLAGQWSRLSMSLTRSGTNVSPSASMDLHEINLRRMEVDATGEETGRVLEWKLAVPRAFLLDENGENGNVYGIEKDDTDYSFVLALQVNEDLKTFTPRTLLKSKGKLPRDILISSSNRVGSSSHYVVANDLCVRASEEKEVAARYGVFTFNSNCYEGSYRCGIVTQLDGWLVGATVTMDIHSEPDKACAIAKSFLNQFTVKRDRDTSLLKVVTP